MPTALVQAAPAAHFYIAKCSACSACSACSVCSARAAGRSGSKDCGRAGRQALWCCRLSLPVPGHGFGQRPVRALRTPPPPRHCGRVQALCCQRALARRHACSAAFQPPCLFAFLCHPATAQDRHCWCFWCSCAWALSSFGGPVAHLGFFCPESVQRRQWLSERSYADLVALYQFLPGPARPAARWAWRSACCARRCRARWRG